MNFSFFKIMSELLISQQAHMTNMQFLGVGVALASVVIGYSHMTKRDQRALHEEMHQTFMKKSEWEETKDKLFERFLSQDEKIRDMEEERKTLELQILTMGKRLKELETEEKGSHQRREERDRQMRSSSDVRELAPNAVNRNLSLPSIFMSEDFSSPWTV